MRRGGRGWPRPSAMRSGAGAMPMRPAPGWCGNERGGANPFDPCPDDAYMGRIHSAGARVFRPILSLFGTVFSLITLIVVIVGLSIGAALHIYGKDLPSHESLANYTPPTISRIYSSEGRIIDEFAASGGCSRPPRIFP